jgi:hypothetical protein
VDVRDELLDGGGIGDVGLEGARIGRACLTELAHEARGSMVARVIDQRQARVLSSERVADATAKSACSASHQHHRFCELHAADGNTREVTPAHQVRIDSNPRVATLATVALRI